MPFETVPNLGEVKGVFQDKYKMYGPYKTELEARDDFGKMPQDIGIYVESNKMMYVKFEKKEVNNAAKPEIHSPGPEILSGDAGEETSPGVGGEEPDGIGVQAKRNWLKPG
jgi:hypothetical protein